MKAKLVGIRETQGVFEGKPFHSIKLHCTAPCIDDGFVGVQVIDPKVTSISFDKLPFIIGRPITFNELSTYVNSNINIDFDQNKRIVGLTFDFDKIETKPYEKK